jgi:hypothetical protein
MATSPNYGWSEPDNTDLVKNGALAIRTLGNDIDTSVWNVGFGQAGKNKIINGDFSVNQRNFTSTTSDSIYIYDRYLTRTSDGTGTYSAQTFTPGAAPVAGYEGKNYLRIVTTGQTLASAVTNVQQRIESVRTFAGQTVTVSFWAKANSGTPKIATELIQNFGSGGSTQVTNYAGQVTLSTSWARYSVTISLPSISGKTIGTSDALYLLLFVSAGTDFNARTGSLGIQSNTFEFWGVQVEYGSKATPFQTASGGSIQGELAMCQRYYYAHSVGSNVNVGLSNYTLSSELHTAVQFPVTMRTAPSLDQVTGTNYYAAFTAGVTDTFDALIISRASATSTQLYQTGATVSGTAGTAGILYTNNAATRLAFTAEL